MTGRILAALAFIAVFQPLLADEVRLKNGNVIKGAIVAESPETVTVKTDHGLVELSRTQIASILRSGPSPGPPEPPSPRQIMGWIEDLKSGDPVREEAATSGLSRAGRGAVLLLTDLLADPGSKLRTRQLAAACLGRIGGPAVEPLAEVLEGADRQARIFAVEALGHMGKTAAPVVPKLIELFNSLKQGTMKRLLKNALWAISLDSPTGTFPELETAIKTENERLARAVLSMIAAGEEKFKRAVCLDRNANGVGEYGYLGELAGTRPLRGTEEKAAGVPYIDPRLGSADSKGRCHFAGYSYILYLMGNRASVHEMGVETGKVAHLQETDFVCYGFPRRRGRTGERVLAVSSRGSILSIPNAMGEWGGDRIPPPGLAYGGGRDPSSRGARFVNGGESGGASEPWEVWSEGSDSIPASDTSGEGGLGALDGAVRVWEEELRRVHGRAVERWLEKLGDGPVGERATSDFLEEIDVAARSAGYEDRNHMLGEAAAVMGRRRLIDFWEDLADERAARLQEEVSQRSPSSSRNTSGTEPAPRLDDGEGYAQTLQDVSGRPRDSLRRSWIAWILPTMAAFFFTFYLLFARASIRGAGGAGLTLVLTGVYVLLARALAFRTIEWISFPGLSLGPVTVDSSLILFGATHAICLLPLFLIYLAVVRFEEKALELS